MDPLLDPSALERYLKAHHLPPLDRFGQHFLVDEGVLQDMVAAAYPDPSIPIIEIGAGLGVLTRALARARELNMESGTVHLSPLIAVERDRRLVPLLKERVKEFPNVVVVEADILDLEPAQLEIGNWKLGIGYDLVGNIPYNITGAILKKFLSLGPRPRRLTLLMDEAVARAITAHPPDMSVRAVSVQTFAEPRIVRRGIPPSAFVPPPAVHSAIVSLTCHLSPVISPAHERAYFRLVRAGFSQKRKVLANALAATYRLRPTEAADRLRAAGIDPRRRAETLSIEEWKRLLAVWEKHQMVP